MTKLSDYLAAQIKDRGWSMRELGRRTGFSHPYISAIINEQRTNPSADFCIAIARALGEQPETILRLAGILPPLPPAVPEEREALGLLRRLSGQARDLAMATLRTLAGRERTPPLPASTINEQPEPYNTAGARGPRPHDNQPDTVGARSSRPPTLSERMAYKLAEELDTLSPEDQQRVIDLMNRLSSKGERPGNITPDTTAPRPGS